MTAERKAELRAGAIRYTGEWAAEMLEALDEIERLERENEALRAEHEEFSAWQIGGDGLFDAKFQDVVQMHDAAERVLRGEG